MSLPRQSTTQHPARPAATEPLFRPQAVALQTAGRAGTPAITRPLPMTVLTLLLGAITTALIAFAALGSYARKESVAGFLEPVDGVIRVYPPRNGIIGAIAVHDGESVAAGDVLFKVTTPQTLADGSDASRERLTAVAAQRRLLQQTRAREWRRADAAEHTLNAQTAALREQLAELAALVRIQSEQRRLADHQLQALRTLHQQGAVPLLQWLSGRSAHLANQEKLQHTRARVSQARGDLETLESSRTTAQQDAASRIAALDSQLLALQRTEIDIASARDVTVRAPVAGRVMALQRTRGEAAIPGQPVLTVIPDASPLVARLLIPTRAIAFVTPGQTVRLRFDAFPHQHFGTHAGVLQSVARSVLFSGDAYGPLTLNQPAYPATVALSTQAISSADGALPLQPGMLLQADIMLEKRSIAAWLAEPLLGLRGRTN